MTVASVFGPFRPGSGATPPHLAGRSEEQRILGGLLEDLDRGVPPSSDVILYGPRGNGKTVLLNWLREQGAGCAQAETVAVLPSSAPDSTRLAERLAPTSWWDRLTPEELAFAGFSWRPGTSGGTGPPPLEQILAVRTRKNPLLMVLDEAHTLDIELGRALLGASQEVRRELPFLLVLAGTPNLQARLAAMDASFWSRSRQLRIGRLDEEATAEAFLRPLEAEGIRVSANLLGELAHESQGYPWFVQLLGEAIWRCVTERAGPKEITPDLVATARKSFDETRHEYYTQRFEELSRQGLLPVARAVADAFHRDPVLDDEALGIAIRTGLGGSPEPTAHERAAGSLRDLGYIWRTRGRLAWEPGIPSLMDFVRGGPPVP